MDRNCELNVLVFSGGGSTAAASPPPPRESHDQELASITIKIVFVYVCMWKEIFDRV